MQDARWIHDILDFWFGELDANGMSAASRHALWFKSDETTDRAVRERYGDLLASALADELNHWAEERAGLVALVLLLDQFTRNCFRGTPDAFAGDSRALALARTAIESGRDRELPAIHRVFLYLPFEHSEDLAAQDEGLAHMDALLASCAAPAREQIAEFRRYAVAHREVIAAFGRFPHRNAILGRETTAREAAHLEQHGGF